MTNEDEKELRKTFLIEFGDFLRKKRLKKNISLDSIAKFMNVTQTTISRYEYGDIDMKLSNIPMLSLCYGFYLKECFSSLDIIKEVECFKKMVRIKKYRYHRNKQRDGVNEEISKNLYSTANITFDVTPASTEEFMEYLKQDENTDILSMLNSAEKILDFVDDDQCRDNLSSKIVDYVIDNLIVEKVMVNPDLQAPKIYMYYRTLYKNILKDKEL